MKKKFNTILIIIITLIYAINIIITTELLIDCFKYENSFLMTRIIMILINFISFLINIIYLLKRKSNKDLLIMSLILLVCLTTLFLPVREQNTYLNKYLKYQYGNSIPLQSNEQKFLNIYGIKIYNGGEDWYVWNGNIWTFTYR